MKTSITTKLLATTIMVAAISLSSQAFAASTPVFTKNSFQGGYNLTLDKAGTTANTFVFDQNGSLASGNFDNLNLLSGQTLKINQLNPNYLAILKVTDNLPTNFAGTLTANGRVVIENGAGLTFTKDSQVNLGALTLTTANTITYQKDGSYQFSNFGPGSVDMVGTINTSLGGYVNVIARNIYLDKTADSTGVINSNGGGVNLVAGSISYTVDLNGDGKIIAESPTLYKSADVEVLGNITSGGGGVLLRAKASDFTTGLLGISGVIDDSGPGSGYLYSSNGVTLESNNVIIDQAYSPTGHETSPQIIAGYNDIDIIASHSLNIDVGNEGTPISGRNISVTSGGDTTIFGSLASNFGGNLSINSSGVTNINQYNPGKLTSSGDLTINSGKALKLDGTVIADDNVAINSKSKLEVEKGAQIVASNISAIATGAFTSDPQVAYQIETNNGQTTPETIDLKGGAGSNLLTKSLQTGNTIAYDQSDFATTNGGTVKVTVAGKTVVYDK